MNISRSQKSLGRFNRRKGFTLIELLVVIIIIGILAGLLLPAIFSGLRRSREFVIQKNITDLSGALETFKNKHGVYPIDFSLNWVTKVDKPGLDNSAFYPIYRDLISEFVDALSSRHAYGNAGQTIFAPGQALENPYFGLMENAPATRDPVNLSTAEGIVFWLYELSENAEYPLGYIPGPSANTWIVDPNKQPKRFYDFKDEKLTDLDGDGWLEFVPDAGPSVPICYFDSRTYQQLTASLNRNQLRDFLNFIEYDSPETGPCYPYLDFAPTMKDRRFTFEEPEKYQLISAGMDGVFSLPTGPPRDFYTSKNDNAQLSIHHNDNIVNFREGRLDNDFETN